MVFRSCKSLAAAALVGSVAAVAAAAGSGGASDGDRAHDAPNLLRPASNASFERFDAGLGLQTKRAEANKPEDAPLPPDRKTEPEAIEPQKLSLGELEGMALGQNPSLAVASARIEAARGAYRQAGLPPNPRVAYAANEVGNEGAEGLQGGYVAQEFITGGKLQLSQAVACQTVLRAQQEFEAQRLRVLTDVRGEFYRVLAAQRRRELAEEVTGLSQKSVDTVKSLLDAGTASGIELLQGKVEVETASLALQAARNRHEAAWRRLAAVIGTPDMAVARLDGDLLADLPSFEWEEILARVLSQSPEITAAQIEAQRAAFALRRAQQQAVPNIDVMLGAQKDFATGDTVANVQIEIPVPIWNRNQGGIYQARAELMAAQADVSRVELSLRRRLAAAFERYSNARFYVDRYEKRILPDSKEALTLTARAYQNGQLGFLNVLAVQRTYFQASIAHLDAVAELRDTAALLDGQMLGDSLESAGRGDAAPAMGATSGN